MNLSYVSVDIEYLFNLWMFLILMVSRICRRLGWGGAFIFICGFGGVPDRHRETSKKALEKTQDHKKEKFRSH